jgi:uncharacterized lipoprotein
MKKLLLFSFLLVLLSTSGCSIFKSSDNINKKRINSFTFNYPQNKVWDALLKVLDDMNLRIQTSDAFKGELTTDKVTFSKDDIENYQKLKDVADVPKSPLSEYFEANYFININMSEENSKTLVSISAEIQALERGRFNKWINMKSSGQKEKEILAFLLKKLKEF